MSRRRIVLTLGAAALILPLLPATTSWATDPQPTPATGTATASPAPASAAPSTAPASGTASPTEPSSTPSESVPSATESTSSTPGATESAATPDPSESPAVADPIAPEPTSGEGTRSIIISFDRKQGDPKDASVDLLEKAVNEVAGAEIAKVKPITSKTVVVTLDRELTSAEAAEIQQATEAVAGVKAVEPSTRVVAASTNDPGYGDQWNLKAASTWGANAEAAWNWTNGSGVVVGVLDTGISPHHDLTGSTTSIVGGNVIAGIDLVSDPTAGGDGNGWDADPTDPGDYCDRDGTESSWHGTHVSGIIAAITNNSKGVAGVAPGAKVQPIRVLGRCGGSLEDIITGIRWGAGLSVAGAPTNPTPAKVLNISIQTATPTPCSTAGQDAINAAVAAGTTIVVSAGNYARAVSDSFPANCQNVIRVAATGPNGQITGYSNYGTDSAPMTLAAPGGSGGCGSSPLNCILSTSNDGATGPGTPYYRYSAGTSQAAPHVAAAAAELKSLNSDLSPSDIKSILAGTTTANNCGTPCGAGLLNVGAAVSSVAAVAEGSFINYNTMVYRIVGGAPIYVTDWAPFGGPQPVRTVSSPVFKHLREYPADGTFARGVPSGRVYRFAGGAPIYVTTWDAFGGGQAFTDIDDATIARASETAEPFNHIRKYPSNGTFVEGRPSGRVYRFAGGAPIYVSTWDIYGGGQATTAVDDAALAQPGSEEPFNHVRQYPSNGTFVEGKPSGRVYRFAGGAPTYVSSWASVGGVQATTAVDDSTLAQPDGSEPLNHVRRYPANGTFIQNGATGVVYRVAGGAPLAITGWTPFGGAQPTTRIDSWEFKNFQHLRARPTDMFLRGLPSGRLFRVVQDGHPYQFSSWSVFGGEQPYVNVDDWAINSCDHLSCGPFGAFDTVSTGSGTVTVAGWAIDPNSVSTAVKLRVYVGKPGSAGTLSYDIGVANLSRPDVAAAHPGVGAAHGFQKTISTTRRGTYPVYVYALNASGTKGTDVSIGHRTATITGPAPPAVTSAVPTIGGTVKVGSKLTAIPGSWRPTGLTLRYQWYRFGKAISGATGATYVVKPEDAATLKVVVTGSKSGYLSRSVASKSTKTVPWIGKIKTGTPTITGKRVVKAKLTAKLKKVRPAGTSVRYQWYRGSSKISGATGAKYRAQKADKRKKISVRVTFTKTGYPELRKTSKRVKIR